MNDSDSILDRDIARLAAVIGKQPSVVDMVMQRVVASAPMASGVGAVPGYDGAGGGLVRQRRRFWLLLGLGAVAAVMALICVIGVFRNPSGIAPTPTARTLTCVSPGAGPAHDNGNGKSNGAVRTASMPVRTEVAEGEIVWWASAGDCVVAVWKDGAAACWNTQTGMPVSQFWIDGFNPSYFRCFASPEKSQLVVVDDTMQNVQGELAKSIRLYDLGTGRLLRTLKPAGYPDPNRPGELRSFSVLWAKGVTADGHCLLVAASDPLGSLVFAIDLESGRTAWHFPCPGLPVGGDNVMFARDGRAVLVVPVPPGEGNLLARKRCIAYSNDGAELWEWSTTAENGWLSLHKSAGEGENTVFCLAEMLRDSQQVDRLVKCIGFSDAGQELWEYDQLVLAISPDGTRSIVADRSEPGPGPLGFHEQSDNVPVNIGPTGLVFTGDGSLLLKLPNLVLDRDTDPENPDSDRVEYYRRADNQLQVTDAQTGQLLREIALTKPPL